MFAKYDADGDRVLNAEEQKAMHDDLEEQRKNIDGEINQVCYFNITTPSQQPITVLMLCLVKKYENLTTLTRRL